MPNALERMQAQQSLRTSPSINNKMPPYPCFAILYSRQERNTTCKVIQFKNQRDFDQCRTFTVARVRVILRDTDLSEVPTSVLLEIHNRARVSRGEQPLTEFADDLDIVEIQRLIIGDLPVVATQYEELKMSPDNEGNVATAAAPTADKSAEKEAAKKAKAAEKEAQKAATAAKRADGVIGTIKAGLDTTEGTTANEVLDKLVAKFPDRTRDGMSSTVKIQFSRLAKSTGRAIHNANIEGRGRVYKFADKGPVPGKVVVETPVAAAPAATPDITPEKAAEKSAEVAKAKAKK